MTMRRTTCAALALIAMLGVTASATAEAPGTAEVTLTGDRSASVDVVFDQDVSARVVAGSTLGDAVIGGSFAGFAIQSLPDERVLLGAVRVPSIEGAGSPAVPYPFSPKYPPVPMPLTPGRYADVASLEAGVPYRLTLLTDGPAVVRLPVTGLATALSLVPSRPTAVRSEILDLDPVPGAQPVPLGTAERPLTLGAATLSLVATALSAVAGQSMFGASCVTGSAPTELCDTNGFLSNGPGSVHSHLVDDHAYLPGALGVGGRVAKYRAAAVGLVTYRKGFWLTWETR